MTPTSPVRRGLTLIEVLVALALLSGLVGAASAWTVGIAKSAAAAARHREAVSACARLRAVLERDLDEAVPDSVTVSDNTLELITLHRPGQRTPGWRVVRWRFDPTDRTLVREEQRTADHEPTRLSARNLVEHWTASLTVQEDAGHPVDIIAVRIEWQRDVTHAPATPIVWRRPR